MVGVAPFFTDNRALAIGICLCGSGVRKLGLELWVLQHFSRLALLALPQSPTTSYSGDSNFVCLNTIQTEFTFPSFTALIHHSLSSSLSSSLPRWSSWLLLQARVAMGDAHILRPLLALHLLWGSHGNRCTRDGFGDNLNVYIVFGLSCFNMDFQSRRWSATPWVQFRDHLNDRIRVKYRDKFSSDVTLDFKAEERTNLSLNVFEAEFGNGSHKWKFYFATNESLKRA